MLEDVAYSGINTTSEIFDGENIYDNEKFDGVKFKFQDFRFSKKCSEGRIENIKYWTYNSNFDFWVNDVESNVVTLFLKG